MKYKNIRITGHQRTGTHYIAALISTNFLNTKDYVKYYLNHKGPGVAVNKKIAYIYTWRDFTNTAKSIFVMRKSFGLNNVKNFEDFLKTRYCDMWKPERDFEINVINLKGDLRKESYVSGYFRKVKATPKEWWKSYYKKWANAEIQKNNVIKVSYNSLKNNFQETMLDVAIKIGSDKKSFKNIDKKIGWNV